jgi:PAS domain S-box-containing protein
MAFSWFGWILFDANRDVKMFAERVSRIEELRGVIVHLDEVLTMSARMTAATKDLQWEERYRHFEPQLDAAIKEVTKIGTDPSDVKAAAKMDEANIKLVEMENRAFALVRAGRKEEAQAVLFSPEYEAQKKIYAEGIKSFTNQIRQEFDESLRNDKRVDLLSIIGALVVGGTSFVAWFSAARGVRRWRAQLLDSFHRRAEAEENLRQAHAQLEVRVKERTADLANANEALQSSEARTKAIVQSSLDCIVTIDHEGKILEFNPAAEIVFGYPRAKVLGMELAEVMIPPSLREQHRQGMKRYLASGEAKVLGKRIEIVAIRSDGTEFPVELAITRLVAEDPPMFTGFIRDITESKRGEEALRQAEEKYRGIFENAVEGIFQTTPDGRFIAANFALARLLGFDSPEELIASRTDIAHDNYVDPESREEFKRLLNENGSVLDFELEAYRKDRSKIWLSENVRAVRDAKGTIAYYEGTAEDITKRKQAEDALRASEERYRSLFESNPNPMWVFDSETLSFLAVNATAVRHYGYSQDEFLAMTLKDIRPPEDIPALMEDLSEKTDDVNNSTQWRHRKKDGTLIDVEITSHELIWIGRLAKLVLINDITKRKDAEKHLAQMEGRYRGLLEAAPDAMVVVNQGGEIVLLNLQAEKQFGYRRDELVGQKVKNIIPDGFAERLVADDLRSAEDALAQQIGMGIELTGRRKNGSDFPIEIMLSPLESADGILVTAAIRDITERKQAEDRLRQQARLLNLAHDAIMVRDMEDRVEFWNHGAEDLYGWTAAEVQGRKASTFLYQDEPGSTAAARADVIEKGKWAGECTHNCKDGGTTTVRSRWTLVRDALAAPKSILIINTDVTEQRKLETHLLRAQRLESIGTLASGVAHDLNNILTPILMCAEVLRQQPSEKDAASSIALIEESARRGASVVKQVLTFARGIEGERVVIKPGYLIQEMIDIAQKTFPKTIEILSRYPNDLWSIEGDPTQLHQVLLNLSVNARDAMPNGGTLTLAAENFNADENYASMMSGAKTGPQVMLRVTDTGHGMPRAMIDKIFDPFFTTKEVGKGTGLGLSTTLGIVKSHGGFISVYSEPSKGTTFKVFLPATVIREDLQQSETSVVPIQGNGHGQLILVVDDEPNILGVTKMILEKHRYDVVSASDGPEALAIFAQQMQAISLVLTDLSMPYMDGIALVRSLKKMRPDLSIVASTGQGEQAGVAELQSLGVKNFLTKPYNTERLLATLDDTLHGRDSESPGVQTTSG